MISILLSIYQVNMKKIIKFKKFKKIKFWDLKTLDY